MITPPLTVIIPTFNEEIRLKKCLKALKEQDYPAKKMKIIIVDDKSTDNTVQLAKSFGVKVIFNGSRNIERGKSLGLENAHTEYVLFLDADNFLITKNWLKTAINVFQENKDLVGLQSQGFLYKKNDTLPNRYCALFGINDPFAYYLGKRGLLKSTEKEWIYPKQVVRDEKNYFLVRFNLHDLPTYGSQGYLTKKSLMLKTHWRPYLFHLDSTYDLVKKGYSKFGFIKYNIEHDYAKNILSMFRKLKRNIDLFFKLQSYRRYKYETNKLKLFFTILIMVTFIVPLIDSIKGYSQKKDLAWFLHPIMCFCVVIIYCYATGIYFTKKSFNLGN